jgi:CheY-like chemotaxis protein
VIDDGEGMDAETLARATEPFFTTKGVGKGTGLGLSMVHGLAEQSGGRFAIESSVGKGTSATLWLPVAGAMTADASAFQPESRSAAESRTLTVLAVDDDSLVLMNTVALLEDAGHTVLDACSGDEALEIFEREPGIDLIITDQAMPGMTGVQLIEQLFAKQPDVSVILATGYGELPIDVSIRVRKLGKPFGQAELERAVADAISQHGADHVRKVDRVAAG